MGLTNWMRCGRGAWAVGFGVLTLVVIAVLSTATASAEEPATGEGSAPAVLDWDAFDDPDFDPAAPANSPAEPDAEAAVAQTPAVPSTGAAASESGAATAETVAGATETGAAAPEIDEPGAGSSPTVAGLAEAAETEAQEPEVAGPAESAEMASAPTAPPAHLLDRRDRIVLGPVGYDEQGRMGRVHTVATGNTLWDISAAYLGTPWVWPSVWHENEEIENPHVISPGELIWITSSEMRRVTREEADDLLAGQPATDDSGSDQPLFETPAAPDPAEALAGIDLDQFPVTVPLSGASGEQAQGPSVRVSDREGMSFVSSESMAAASSLLGATGNRVFFAGGDDVYLGLGDGETAVGDQFTIFRDSQQVRDIDGTLLGYHVEVLGWAEVTEVYRESSLALVRMSVDPMEKGDRIVPRQVPAQDVVLRTAPSGLEGHVIFLPDGRTVMGTTDYLYVNRGSIHGVEVGSTLEVVAPRRLERDEPRGAEVAIPARPIAELIVVSVKPDSCVAVITLARDMIRVGDQVRSRAQVAARD